ncbi:unnamed protein product [Arctia plantaginis]|uniref:Uncharacterized protein n=1 Tax=Arctia plantaginis TaxID=874455 RepID=A0A8S1ALH7_ARCPL|nr:unnamed protein product [Arctia plantaginis]
MLRIVVACLIVKINLSLALSNTDRHEHKVPPQSNHTQSKRALTYNLDSTKHSLSSKEQKVIIQLLTEKPLSKTFKKDLDTEKLSLGLPEIHEPPAEKTTKEWSAFRRWKENAEGKPPVKSRQPRTFTAEKSVSGKLALHSLTTLNPAIINPFQIVKDTLVNNILTGESITKQQAITKLQSGKSSLGKTFTQKPTVEWAALRRSKENVDENPITIKSLTDETALSYWQRNISETISTTRKHELINVVDKQPPTEGIEIESHSISGIKTTVVVNFYKKSTTKKLAFEKSATKKLNFYNSRNNLIKKKLNKTPLTRYRARNKKVLQNTPQRTLQTIKSTTEKSRKYKQRIPSWKIIEKLLREKKARHKPVSKKAASIKRAAPQKPPQLCWDGREVQQIFHINFIWVLNCYDYDTNCENGDRYHLDQTKRHSKRQSGPNRNQIKHSRRKMAGRPWYYNHTIGQHDLGKYKKKPNTVKIPRTQSSTKKNNTKNYTKNLDPKTAAQKKLASKFKIPRKQTRTRKKNTKNVTEKVVSKKVARKKLTHTVKPPRRLNSTKKKVTKKVRKEQNLVTKSMPKQKKGRKFRTAGTTKKPKKVKSTTAGTVKKLKKVKSIAGGATKNPTKGKSSISRTRKKNTKGEWDETDQ